ncbi:hypothetical protein [Kordiimonas sp.]|uniref:hypothetical protein n=1 Tax=Kordiimonas sp. TaxID=1970157 RepID=UPI003A954E79
MLNIAGICRQFGGSTKLGIEVTSFTDLGRLVEHGIPQPALAAFIGSMTADKMCPTPMFIQEGLVSKAAFNQNSTFKGALAERILRAAHLRAVAEDLIGSPKGANEFLFRNHIELGGVSPFEASASVTGASAAERILESAALGLPL